MQIETMTTEAIWAEIREQLTANTAPYAEMNVAYTITLTGEEGGEYGLVFKEGQFETLSEKVEDADCTLILSVSNFKKLLAGNLNTTASFMMGKLKVKGNIGLALTLEQLLKQYQFS